MGEGKGGWNEKIKRKARREMYKFERSEKQNKLTTLIAICGERVKYRARVRGKKLGACKIGLNYVRYIRLSLMA